MIIVVAAAAATTAKSGAESALQPAAERLWPPASGQERGWGADPAGHPENMPPAELVDQVARSAGHDPLGDQARRSGSQLVHWAMGIGTGTAYGWLGRRWPVVAAGRGAAFGAALFIATHASSLPVAGLQERPSRLPRAWWVWEGGSHLVYGLVLDTALRVGRAAVRSVGRTR